METQSIIPEDIYLQNKDLGEYSLLLKLGIWRCHSVSIYIDTHICLYNNVCVCVCVYNDSFHFLGLI